MKHTKKKQQQQQKNLEKPINKSWNTQKKQQLKN